MSDTIDQQIHDLLDEAHLLFLSMALPGPIDRGKASDLVVRVKQCAEQARDAGKGKSAEQLIEAASLIEEQLAKRSLSKAANVDDA